MNHTIKQLQFEQIRKEVIARAIGDHTKERLAEMSIPTNLQTVETRQTETKRSPYDFRK